MHHKLPKQLDASVLTERVRPAPRILQFGGGNFMRAFFDLKVDLMNEDVKHVSWPCSKLRLAGDPVRINEDNGDRLSGMVSSRSL